MRVGCLCDRGSHAWGRQFSKDTHCPACWVYWHDAEHNRARGGDGNVFHIRTGEGVKIEWPEPTCARRGKPTGEVDSCHTCSGRIPVPLIHCDKLGKTCYVGNYTVTGSQSCNRCPVRESNLPDEPKVGVVIGSYKWPRVVEANVQLIRRTCGDIPILVSDDCSKEQDTLKGICLRLGVDFVSTPSWMGHVGGDAAAFGHGLLWARDRGLDVLAKLSMRVWMLRDRWVQRGAEDLLVSGLPISTQDGNFGNHRDFPLRSEAVLLKVAAFDPGPFFNAPFHPLNGEQMLLCAMPGTKYHPWADLTVHREERVGHLMTHWTHDEHEYRDVARRVGVTLEPSFHGSGWESENAVGEYKWG